MLTDDVEVASVVVGIESLVEASLCEFVTDGVTDFSRLDVAVVVSAVEPGLAPEAVLSAEVAASVFIELDCWLEV